VGVVCVFNIQLPQIETIESRDDYGRFRIEPLEPGWGHTLGSSLRRILLSSLLGAAVTAIRLEPLNDDMSGVDGIQDNLLDIILNVKQVRVKATGDQFQGGMRLTLRPDGTGTRLLTAADLQLPDGIEVINPDTELLTPTAEQGHWELELLVEQGRGYVPADEQPNTPPDMIPLDATYTPILRVDYVIEHTRVGQNVDYDRLLLEITTDGTLIPEDALGQAAKILTRYANTIANFGQDEGEPEEVAAQPGPAPVNEAANLSLDDLGLSVRTVNALKRANINTVAQALAVSDNELLGLRNFGHKSLDELKDALTARGFEKEATPEE
jgi:DNA-directed RNA polymerase subunit alpha